MIEHAGIMKAGMIRHAGIMKTERIMRVGIRKEQAGIKTGQNKRYQLYGRKHEREVWRYRSFI